MAQSFTGNHCSPSLYLFLVNLLLDIKVLAGNTELYTIISTRTPFTLGTQSSLPVANVVLVKFWLS